MILIADSGATKTDWRLISNKSEVCNVKTIGFNPYFIDTEEIVKVLKDTLIPYLFDHTIQKIFFYGAGCSTLQKNDIIIKALHKLFGKIEIHVEHDILAAARGLFGNSEGIACILGTGSNSCYYDGIETYEGLPSLGYIYGDEGSGAQLGKYLVEAYMKKKLPEDLNKKFNEKYLYSIEDILTNTYKKSSPNRFLASFTNFYTENKNSEYLKAIEIKCFNDFIDYFIISFKNYKEVPIGFIGSVAYFFSDSLKKAFSERGLEVYKIVKSPIEGLIDFHSND
jgi:glucosamine kinase